MQSKFVSDDESILAIIKAIKKGVLCKKLIANFKSEVLSLANECECILIACTEFSTLKHHVPRQLACLDSLDCLADEIVTKSTENDLDLIRQST